MTRVDPPSDFDNHSLAEFIESELLFGVDDYLSISEIRGMFPVGNQPSDVELSFALAEIERRVREFGGHYPYLVDERGVFIDRSPWSSLYSFLLILSIKGTEIRATKGFPRSDPLFDAVVREAFRSERGPRARTLIFGSPARDGRPTRLDLAVRWVAESMGLGVREGAEIPTHTGDSGVDVVVWRPFPDRRNGFQVMLVQNTVCWDFRKKPRDVRPKKWYLWIDLGTEPGVGFAVPFSMPVGDIWWDEVTEVAALVMDRGRLLHALEGEDPRLWAEWEYIREFVHTEIEAAQRGSLDLKVPRARRRKSSEERMASE